MNMPEILLSLTVLALALGGGVTVWRLSHRVGDLQEQLAAIQRQHELQQQSISGLTAGAVGMDRRLRRSEAAEKLIQDRQETFENQQSAEQPYGHAIRLVQQGATSARLVEELSISESEADLIVRLHGLRDSA